MEHYLLSATTIEAAQARAAAFEATGHGRHFAKQLKEARAGLDTIGADDLQYIRDLIDSCNPLYDVLTGLYSLGYKRGQAAGPDLQLTIEEGGAKK